MRFPGRLKPGAVSQQVMTMMDYFPTLTGACGISPGNKLPLDGKNLWTAITGDKVERREDLFFVVESGGAVRLAVRHDEWKLVREESSSGEVRNHLFHIEEDPTESNDLSVKNPKVVLELAHRLAEWRKLHPPDGVRESARPNGWKAPPLWVEAAREA
jgi:arylsulfatase A-like enzyme